MNTLTFGSLFAGIGGFDLGFERAGFECRWQVEIDDYATKILEKHWPKVHRQRDIRECNSGNLERVDCIIGGFPCQDISYAGRGAGLAGERSGLFFEAVRLVRELQPRAVVLENVAALLTRGLDRVLGTLAEIGYDAEWHCIPAAAVGAPHIRDRVFIHAYRNSKPALSINAEVGKLSGASLANTRCELREPWSISESSSEETSHRNTEANNAKRCGEDVADTSGIRWGKVKDESRNDGQQQKARQGWMLKSGGESWWAVEPAVGRVAHGVPARVDRLRCLGNAIVPQVAEVVAKMTREAIK